MSGCRCFKCTLCGTPWTVAESVTVTWPLEIAAILPDVDDEDDDAEVEEDCDCAGDIAMDGVNIID